MDAPSGTLQYVPSAIRPVECLLEAWELIRPVYWLFFGITIAGKFIGAAVPIILMGPIMVGIFHCLLKRERGETVAFGDLFKGFDQFADSLIANVLIAGTSILCYGAVMSVCFILFFFVVRALGDGATWVTAVLALALMYGLLTMVSVVVGEATYFVFQLIAERELKAVEAVKLSVAAARRNLMGIFLLMLLTMGVGMVALLVVGVGVYFIQPVLIATSFVAYRKVFPKAGAMQ